MKELNKEFPQEELEWRVIRSGTNAKGVWAIVAPYVQSRAIMNRLDSVVGPEGWQVKHHAYQNGVITSLGIKVGDEWIWKDDGAGFTDVESFKGGISDGLKRAGVVWGIGRYLYDLPTPMFASFDDNGKYSAKIGDKYYKWNPPHISESTQTHEEAPESTPEQMKDIIVLKLKEAADNGLYTEEEFIEAMKFVQPITNPAAIKTVHSKLEQRLKERAEARNG
jgi:hypothetical protein